MGTLMAKPYLRDLRSDAERLQHQVGDWVVAGVETTAPWPTKDQVVPYQGLDFILRASTEDRAPTVCLNARVHGLTSAQARDAILRFGSAMAWSGDWRFEVTMWVGGSHPIGIGRMRGSMVQDFFDVDELGAINDDDTATALAFFREGVTTHNPFYAFLNLYKVIAFIHRNNEGKVRGKWISEALPRLTERRAVDRLAALQKDGTDAAKYLWEEGRNAIAHSEKGTFVNPDRIGDQERIERDLPVIQAMARLAIEEHYGVHHRLSPKLARRSPVAGFLAVFGEDLRQTVLAGEALGKTPIKVPDSLTVLVRRGGDVHAFEGMVISAMDQVEDGLILMMCSADNTVRLNCLVNLRSDALEMEHGDIEHDLNRSSRSSLDVARRVHAFIWAYLCNGSLEIWNEESDTLLGKSEPYMPVNMFVRPAWHDECLAALATLQANATDD